MKKLLLPIFLILEITMILGYVSAQCTDSDNGMNYFSKGKVTLNNQNFNDACVYKLEETNAQNYVIVDNVLYNNLASCYGDNCYVAEAVCSGDEKGWSIFKCVNGCKDGACLNESITIPSPVCSDSDGQNYFLKGSVKDATGERFDYCKKGDNGEYIAEYFCSNNEVKNEPFLCVNGCNDGACNPVTTNQCTDSDGGINYYLNGTTRYGKYDYIDWCVTSDSVVNQGQSNEYILKKGDLIEYACNGEDGQSRCSDTSCRFIKYHCENGCSNGACLKEGCEKVCKNIGTKSEGWYNSCTGELLEWALCGGSLCSDSDNGLNYYELGTTKWKVEDGSTNSENDYCIDKSTLSEGVCGKTDENGKSYRREPYTCANGCKEGACIKGEPISEKITCKFENTKKEQQCYLAGQWGSEDEGTKFCKADAGSASCVITYSGFKGEQITWKSTCGQYQYTTQDGNEEVIYFKCNEGETNITEVENKGFSFAYWQCQNGEEQKSEDKTSCKLSETWQKYAKDFCVGKCTKEDSKSGCISSFSIWNECYTDKIGEKIPDCSLLNCPNAYYNYDSKECVCGKIDKEPFELKVICKDSCALDGKCYPFGYRKSENFCSDEGKFIGQLKADSSCDNNFECSSNVCVSGKCIDEGLIQKILNWFKKIFGGK